MSRAITWTFFFHILISIGPIELLYILKNHRKMDHTSEGKLTDEDKLTKIREFKEKGNGAHKDGNYKKAARSYYTAILYIKGLSTNCPDMADLTGLSGQSAAPTAATKLSPEMMEESKKLTCDCYNNLAGMQKAN